MIFFPPYFWKLALGLCRWRPEPQVLSCLTCRSCACSPGTELVQQAAVHTEQTKFEPVTFGPESLWIILRALIKGCKIDVFILLFIWKRTAPPERGGKLISALQTARENVSMRWSLSFHYLRHGCGAAAAALRLFPLQLSLNTSPDKNNRNLKTRHTARETAVNKT